LEAEGRCDQLDHVEIEALVDRHHLPELLEGEADDLLGGYLQDVRELGDRDELGHAHQRLLALLLVAPLLLLDLAEARPFLAAVRARRRREWHSPPAWAARGSGSRDAPGRTGTRRRAWRRAPPRERPSPTPLRPPRPPGAP